MVLLVVLLVLMLASAGCLVWLLSGRSGAADDRQAERDAVMSQARQFMLRSYTYGPDDLDDAGRLTENRAQVEEVVTDKFGAAYEESITAIEQLVKSQGVGQAATVHGVGVQYLDGDSARALVAGSRPSPSGPTTAAPRRSRPQTFRMVVDLVKVSGDWLVDQSNTATPRAGAGRAVERLRRPRRPRPRTEPADDPDLVRPARRRAARVRGRDPGGLAVRHRRASTRATVASARSTRPPRCSSTRPAGRRTTPSWPRWSRRRRLPTSRRRRPRLAAPRRRVVPTWVLLGLGLLTAALVVGAALLARQPSDDAVADAARAAQAAAERAVPPVLSYDAADLEGLALVRGGVPHGVVPEGARPALRGGDRRERTHHRHHADHLGGRLQHRPRRRRRPGAGVPLRRPGRDEQGAERAARHPHLGHHDHGARRRRVAGGSDAGGLEPDAAPVWSPATRESRFRANRLTFGPPPRMIDARLASSGASQILWRPRIGVS